MKTTNVPQPPKWGRMADAVRHGLSRSELYNLIKEGKIESFVYKSRPDAVSGVRMINLDSLTAFIDAQAAAAKKEAAK